MWPMWVAFMLGRHQVISGCSIVCKEPFEKARLMLRSQRCSQKVIGSRASRRLSTYLTDEFIRRMRNEQTSKLEINSV